METYTDSKSKMSIMLAVVFVTVLFIFQATPVYPSTTPVYEWVYKYPTGITEGFCVSASDGGFAAVVDTNILKFDSYGKKEWQMVLVDGANAGGSLVQTTDKGYIFVALSGLSALNPGSLDVYKTDSSGVRQWKKSLPLSNGKGYLTIRNLKSTLDGGFILSCSYSSESSVTNGYLKKFDKNGRQEWQTDTVDREVDQFINVEQARDGGYIVSGVRSIKIAGVEAAQHYIFKFDARGKIKWKKEMPETGSNWSGIKLQQTYDGDYVAAVVYYQNNYSEHGVLNLLKIDSGGREVWKREAGVKRLNHVTSILETRDRGLLILTGWHAVKTDSTGNIEWEKDLPGVFKGVNQVSDNRYVLAGSRTQRGISWWTVLVGITEKQSVSDKISTPQEKYARLLNLYDMRLDDMSSFMDNVKKTSSISRVEKDQMDVQLARFSKEIDKLTNELLFTGYYNFEDFAEKFYRFQVVGEQYNIAAERLVNKKLYLPDELERKFGRKAKCVNEDFDGIAIIKDKGFYSLDLRNVRNYSISETRIDIESKSGKKYFVFVIPANGDQKFPAFSGLGIVKNNIKYVFNTVNYKKRVSGEWINIRDAVTYLMDGNKKTYLKYKDLTVTKGKNNVYTISIGNVFDKKNQQYFWANGSTWNTPNIYFSVNTKPPVKVTYFLDVNQAVNIVDNGSKVEIKLKNSKYILEVKK